MPRPKTPYVTPPPPSAVRPDNLFRKYVTRAFGGQYGHLRAFFLLVGGVFVVDAAILADAYIFRKDKYPTPDRSFLYEVKSGIRRTAIRNSFDVDDLKSFMNS